MFWVPETVHRPLPESHLCKNPFYMCIGETVVVRPVIISLHLQASATPQNVMNMADMASRTAQLWLEFAESEASHPEQALPAPDAYNQAFYRFTRKDPDNEVWARLICSIVAWV